MSAATGMPQPVEVEGRKDLGRKEHAADRCADGQRGLLDRCQLSCQRFAPDHEAGEQEYYGHEPFVDPVAEGLGERRTAERQREVRFPEVVIGRSQRRQVRPDEGKGCGDDQQDAARCFQAEKGTEGPDQIAFQRFGALDAFRDAVDDLHSSAHVRLLF